MKGEKIPVSVIAIACLYLAVGAIGFVFHFKEFRSQDGVWIELTEFLAVVCGIFMLRGENWARWLAIAWMSFHVALSAFGALRDLIVHGLFLAAIAWLLFRPEAARHFRGARRNAS
jgi:hypothetical protein